MKNSRHNTVAGCRLAGWFITILAATLCAPASYAEQPADIHMIKSALVLNFTRYSSWPQESGPSSEEPSLTIGVLGKGEIVTALRSLDGQRSGLRTLKVVRMTGSEDAAGVDAIFVSEDSREIWPAVRTAIAGRPVLTIGERSGFLAEGGLINLVRADGRFRFEVNLAGARAVDLRISSKLLKLASTVLD